MASSGSASELSIQHKRLRAPKQHGESLQVPPLTDANGVLKSNLNLRSSSSANAGLAELQKLARTEILQLASQYSQSYLDASNFPINESDVLTGKPIIMAGHQPELFHPGVWYKNFVLSGLGKRFGAVAINLVVDNDLSGNATVRYPRILNGETTVGSIPLVQPGPNVPFENRTIVDWELFQSFGNRVQEAIGKTGPQRDPPPIANRLWPHVLAAKQKFLSSGVEPRLGQLLTAGRHRLESEIGLRTLEVPISQLAQTNSFAMFAEKIIGDLERFHAAYNESLLDYRAVHGIRSSSHPVPELETENGWLETPFWIWRRNQGDGPIESSSDQFNRKRLFAKSLPGKVLLTDRAQLKLEIENSKFMEQFRSLAQDGIAIRPRALMTTMFLACSRVTCSYTELAALKYDQLTDVICKRFFSAQLPSYLTLSATFKLPTDVELVRRADITATSQMIRELKFHPETLIENPPPEAVELIEEKHRWTVGEKPSWRSRQKHLKIESLNSQLGEFLKFSEEDLIAKRAEQMAKLRASEILDSREYSFCLFPESLIDELKALASF